LSGLAEANPLLEQTTEKLAAVPSVQEVDVPPAAGAVQVVVGGVTVTLRLPEVTVPAPPGPVAVKVRG
jgi:hypothetical protein